MADTKALRAFIRKGVRVRLSLAALRRLGDLRGIAQLVERAVWDREVGGSSPLSPTHFDEPTTHA
jgi:hypothetical protein